MGDFRGAVEGGGGGGKGIQGCVLFAVCVDSAFFGFV